MALNFMLPLRVTQFVLAIPVLGLNAYVVSWFENRSLVKSPSEVNFLIFTAIWTAFLVVPFFILAPRFFAQAAHPFVVLAVEALTVVFWFAGFIAQADLLSEFGRCAGKTCRSIKAATYFAAFEWILFQATTVLAARHVLHSRKGGAAKNNPQMASQP